jgi:SlyX protein
MDNRLTEIEIKMAHMEQSLNELSDVLYRQQALLDRLERGYQHLRQRVENSAEPGEAESADEKPPHY